MAEEVLPLFPLNVVLFPDSALPLHIFEERYRRLIRECLEDKGKEFGINFVDGEKLSSVGCTAVVREVVQRYEDGRLDIVVQGRRRYELHRVEETVAPYFVGHVSFVEDQNEKRNHSVAAETTKLYNRLVEVVYGDRLPKLSTDPTSECISFVMAQKAGMDLQRRQQLLEMKSENQRLQMLQRYLATVVPTLQHAKEIQRIVNSDGYLTH